MKGFLDYALQQLLIEESLGKFQRRARLVRRVLLSASLMLLTMATIANAADGDLDRSYGNGGIGVIRVDGRTAYAVGKPILLADGKLLLGGVSNVLPMQNVGSSVIVRVNEDGTLDRAFGDNGRIINTALVNLCGLALLPDGKIIAAGGYSDDGDLKFAAVRYNADGTLDATFGAGGFAIGTRGAAKALAVQADGKIVVAGYAAFDAAGDDFVLARFNANGNVDADFGANGFVRTDFSQGDDRVSSVAAQPDGRIVAGGFATARADFFGGMRREDFALARYDSRGILDASFGDGGVSTIQFGRRNLAAIQNFAIQPDEKITAVGNYTPSGEGMAMARLDRNGGLDVRFGDNGTTDMDYPGITSSIIFRSVAVERDGKMLSVAATTENAGQRDFFLLARCTRFGAIDETLDGEGEVLIRLGTNTVASSIITLPDGKTIVAGVSDGNFFAARFVAPRPAQFDFDGDGRADLAVFRPNEGTWYLSNSSGASSAIRYGSASDKITPADFDGDGKNDVAVYRGGIWFVLRTSDNQTSVTQFGAADDIPVAADYDGDNRADVAVYRPSNSTWYILRSSDGQMQTTRFGAAEDKPTVGDFDGDGKNDIAVFRPSTGVWYRINSRDNQFFARQFGTNGDVAAAADFDGDGKTDIAVYRGGIWYISQSSDDEMKAVQFGASDDVPVPADYDGDSRADVSVFRPSAGDWYCLNSNDSQLTATHWGTSGDAPVAAAYIR